MWLEEAASGLQHRGRKERVLEEQETDDSTPNPHTHTHTHFSESGFPSLVKPEPVENKRN